MMIYAVIDDTTWEVDPRHVYLSAESASRAAEDLGYPEKVVAEIEVTDHGSQLTRTWREGTWFEVA